MVFPRPPEQPVPPAAAAAPGRRRRRSRRGQQIAAAGESGGSGGSPTVRREQERRRQRIAITLGAVLILIVATIIGWGYYQEFYRPPRELAGQIRDVRFTMGDLVDRIRVLQGRNRYRGGRVDLSTVPFEYLQDMLQAEILRQAAPGLGFSVTEEDIDARLRRQFLPTPPEGQEVDAGQLDQEYENAFAQFRTATGLSEEEYRVLVEEELLRNYLFSFINASIPDEMEQVEVAWIRLELDGPVAPEEVRTRLARADFATVAAEVSAPARQNFADREGYVGWIPQEAFPDLDNILFGNPDRDIEPLGVGEISEPQYTQDGVYIVRKIAGPEVRPLRGVETLFAMDEAALDNLTPEEQEELSREIGVRGRLAQARVDQWFADQLALGSDDDWLTINFDSELYAWVADQVQLSAPRVEQPGPPVGGPGFP